MSTRVKRRTSSWANLARYPTLSSCRVEAREVTRSGERPAVSRHLPADDTRGPEPAFRLIKRSAIKPSRDEEKRNPRSRSARLRVAERTDAPPSIPAGGN